MSVKTLSTTSLDSLYTIITLATLIMLMQNFDKCSPVDDQHPTMAQIIHHVKPAVVTRCLTFVITRFI